MQSNHILEDNKKLRLQICISILDRISLPHDPMFVDIYNIVHIDENVLDLGFFFHAIQSLQYRKPSKTIYELSGVVNRPFETPLTIKVESYIFEFAIMHD